MTMRTYHSAFASSRGQTSQSCPMVGSNSLSVSDEGHLDINSVANIFEGPIVKCATNVSAPDDGDGSSRCRTPLWRRSKSLGKPAEACGRVQHHCVSRPDQDETLERSTLER